MIAAANASMMSRVRVCTSSDASSSARKIPAMAAIPDPSAHENIDTRPGFTPFRPASSRLSTTARIATPRRVRDRRNFNPTARSRPVTMVMKRDQGMSVWPIMNPSVPKNRSIRRGVCGSQKMAARPMRASMRPIVVTICATSGASASRRIRTISMIAPISGAATKTVRMNATNVCMPRSVCSVQKMNAPNIPIAPCAKLKMPDVV